MKLIKVFATTSFVGYHRWPGAPPHRDYLRVRHRHRFGVRVEVDAHGDDRELEFHDLLDVMTDAVLRVEVNDVGSCEQVAGAIGLVVAGRWPKRRVEVVVDEDGECGAVVCLLP